MKPYLPLDIIDAYLPAMRRQEVARSRVRFLSAYRRAGGDPVNLSDYWRERREGFIARHMAQVVKRHESLFVGGKPTRRHLALIAWAYSPQRSRLDTRLSRG